MLLRRRRRRHRLREGVIEFESLGARTVDKPGLLVSYQARKSQKNNPVDVTRVHFRRERLRTRDHTRALSLTVDTGKPSRVQASLQLKK